MTGIIAAFRNALFAAQRHQRLPGGCAVRLGGSVSVSAVPTRAEVMSLVRQYALARTVQNASVPTKRRREVAAIVEAHERDCREVERLAREIVVALARAGLR